MSPQGACPVAAPSANYGFQPEFVLEKMACNLKLYFMGVCGTAMGNAALLARASGHEVTGADEGVYPPMSTVLAEAGVAVHEGYDPERLAPLKPDMVVVGNAMMRGNPEVEWLLDTKALPFTSLPAMLHDQMLRHRRNIVIAGTHGKTTTTALAAFLLRENGRDPGYLIGGVPQDPADGQPPRGRGRSLCDRGRRVRQRVLRQAEQVHPLRAARRGVQQPRVRPRGHLPRPGRRPARLHPFLEDHPTERVCRAERRRRQPARPGGDAMDPGRPRGDGRGE